MKNKKCIVIFPVYRPLTEVEAEVFAHALEMTKGFEHIFIAPQSMVFDKSFEKFMDIPVTRFKDEYFKNIAGYNHLMLSTEFYKAFTEYEYMLIHQGDAYLFKPELEYWCDRGYDYIGAPWLRPHKFKRTKIEKKIVKYAPFLYPMKARRRRLVRDNVGNGGLSLRKVGKSLAVLENVNPKVLETYKMSDYYNYNEDVFWAVEAEKVDKSFKRPAWQEALRFSFEKYPAWSYEYINGQLPFGCHAFEKFETDFWKKYIPFLQ